VQDQVKPSFVMFDIRLTKIAAWHSMLFSCSHMATASGRQKVKFEFRLYSCHTQLMLFCWLRHGLYVRC